MTREEAIEILTKELKCNNLDECNLKCDECGVCVDPKDLMEAYGMAIKALGRPKGKWISLNCFTESYALEFKCSICGHEGYWGNYCPNCGAKMEVENG